MPKFIVLSGKKQSGKTTTANYLCKSLQNKYVSVKVKKLREELRKEDNDWFVQPMVGYPSNLVKITSFASPIKDFCKDVLGLTEAQIYGTDKEKNSDTHIRWENMPDEIRLRNHDRIWTPDSTGAGYMAVGGKGPMTAREVMQIFGTDIMRNFFDSNVWAKAPFTKFADSGNEYVIIDDCRFPNEADMALEHGATLIRLKRDVMGEDVHISEKALDNYDESNYHHIIDNNKYNNIQSLYIDIERIVDGTTL